jgi:perosamine synthetase
MDKNRIRSLICQCKLEPRSHELSLAGALSSLRLVPLGPWILKRPEILELLTVWRRNNQHAYPTVFNVTVEGTTRWAQARIIDDPERILFGVFDQKDQMIAHAGLATFDWEQGDVEIDNVMRGDAGHKGLMTAVTNRLVEFAYDEFGMKSVSLKVFGDNYRAVQLYLRCGFRPVGSIPMGCEMTETEVRWVAQSQFVPGQTYRIFLRMTHEHAHEKRILLAA